MSDNFRILGVGGAGINTVKALGYRNSVFIDSSSFDPSKAISDIVGRGGRDDKIIIVSSPAGDFSSSVLRSICNVFNSNGNRVFLIGILPFLSESPERKRRGELLLKELRGIVDSTVIVENENFASSMMERSWTEVLGKINDYVDSMVKSFVSSNGETEVVKSGEPLPSGGSLGYAPNATISLN
jgi:cell division GTPase FtsZ